MNISHEKRQQVRRSKGFRWTNDVWNELNLNAGWSIGLITKIVDDKQFESFKEWESYYFETGQIRQERLKRAIPTTRVRLIDLRAVYKDSQTFKKGLTNYEVDINEAHGRTMDELKGLARVMHEEIIKRGNPYNLSAKDCFTHIYIRVVDEAYIGFTEKKYEDEMFQVLEKSNGYEYYTNGIFTGEGVTIGLLETGIMDVDHPNFANTDCEYFNNFWRIEQVTEHAILTSNLISLIDS